MSVLLSCDDGWVVSHLDYLNDIYKDVAHEESFCSLEFNETFFDINSQFLRDNQIAKSEQGVLKEEEKKPRKRKKFAELPPPDLEQINHVKEAFLRIQSRAVAKKLFGESNNYDNNEGARALSDNFYLESSQHKLGNFHGSNKIHTPIIIESAGQKYVFPQRCSFYCYDVGVIGQKLDHIQFDFILLDPPWWNKFVRRKKEKCVQSSYKMMYNEDFAKIPIETLLAPDGMVAVWCTNAQSHLHSIMNEMFPKWGVAYTARWYWVKVTQSGSPVCDFNTSGAKRPYESLIFGRKTIGGAKDPGEIERSNLPDGKLLVSVPSGVHSHKPPIADLVKSYLPEAPKCLEIFARYLLPDWTSWGLEVLKFQHLSLYRKVKRESDSHENKATAINEIK